MSITQVANLQIMQERIDSAETTDIRRALAEIFRGVHNVQAAIDIAFDLWIALGTILLGAALLSRLALRPVIGVIGILAGMAVLIGNFARFPHPPAEVGGIDYGPVVGAWFFVVLILVIFHHIRDSDSRATPRAR